MRVSGKYSFGTPEVGYIILSNITPCLTLMKSFPVQNASACTVWVYNQYIGSNSNKYIYIMWTQMGNGRSILWTNQKIWKQDLRCTCGWLINALSEIQPRDAHHRKNKNCLEEEKTNETRELHNKTLYVNVCLLKT